MSELETTARALAKAHYQGRFGPAQEYRTPGDDHAKDMVERCVDDNWRFFEADAAITGTGAV